MSIDNYHCIDGSLSDKKVITETLEKSCCLYVCKASRHGGITPTFALVSRLHITCAEQLEVEQQKVVTTLIA